MWRKCENRDVYTVRGRLDLLIVRVDDRTLVQPKPSFVLLVANGSPIANAHPGWTAVHNGTFDECVEVAESPKYN